MVNELYDQLLEAVRLEGDRAGIRIRATYEPAGGPGARLYPPTFGDEKSPYLLSKRVVDGQVRDEVLLDSVPSQANRVEEALLKATRAGRVRVPLIEIRHEGAEEVTITSLEAPHRYADAYLRDSEIDGVPFDKTAVGEALQRASVEDATALYRHDPGSLVFGAWNSHRKGRQEKFARSYSSEVVGWDPEVGRRAAGRMDPLNLIGAAKPVGDGWEFEAVGSKTKGARLSERGLGNIAPNETHGGVTVTSAERIAHLSLAGLARLGFAGASPEAADAARVALAAYALLGDRLAFGGPALWLRSGCELVTVTETCAWTLRGGATEDFSLTVADAIALYEHATARAAELGLAMSFDVVTLTPAKNLADAIDYALTKATAADGD